MSPQIVDQVTVSGQGELAFSAEREIAQGRRAFPVTQQLFAGSPFGATRSLIVGWHDSSVHPESGSFAVVGQTAGEDDLVGEVVQVSLAGRSALVYVIQRADVPVQLSLARRPFAALGRLSIDSAIANVVIVR